MAPRGEDVGRRTRTETWAILTEGDIAHISRWFSTCQCPRRGKKSGKKPPGTSAPEHIKDTMDHAPDLAGAGSAPRLSGQHKGRQHSRSRIREVTRVCWNGYAKGHSKRYVSDTVRIRYLVAPYMQALCTPRLEVMGSLES